MSSVRYIRLDAAGDRGFSGAGIVPGADVWLGSEASRSLEPDGWLVRRNSSRRQAMKTRMRRRSPSGGGGCRAGHNVKKVKSCVAVFLQLAANSYRLKTKYNALILHLYEGVLLWSL